MKRGRDYRNRARPSVYSDPPRQLPLQPLNSFLGGSTSEPKRVLAGRVKWVQLVIVVIESIAPRECLAATDWFALALIAGLELE
jgi:hypothetical protein